MTREGKTMAEHERFNFKTLDELRKKTISLDLELSYDDDLSPLFQPVRINGMTAPNALSTLPMEGCDGERDGSPSDLVRRRYLRFAGGGYGLHWWEACAILEEGRANELQLWLTESNVRSYADLVDQVRKTAWEAGGTVPVQILQLTHSGRYSRPRGHEARPRVPQRDPLLDPRVGIFDDSTLVTDAYLEALVPLYVKAARLAQEAGFDGVDVKSCHRYLLSELLASHTRPGPYGGCFENRTRLLLEIVSQIRSACGPDFIIGCRFNAFDAHPYPYGFGCDRDDPWRFDPKEPVELALTLKDRGVDILSCTMGNPYYIYPYVTRPFDQPGIGGTVPEEHPLESIARMFAITRKIQEAVGDLPVVGSGYSWLRQYLPHAGAANVRQGACAFVGMGRCAFAYPDAPRDLADKGTLDPARCCIACSKCTQIMRDHGRTGCVVRDAKVYAPLYRQYRNEAEARQKGEGQAATKPLPD